MAFRRENRLQNLLLAGTIIVLSAVLVYVFGPFLSPAASASRVTRIHFADRISPAYRKVIQRFNELHRGRIEAVPVDLPFDKFSTNERKELLARSLRSGGDKLDLFAVDLIWVQRFARWCEPLDHHVSQAERDHIMPVALRSCYHDTTLVALPLYLDIGLMYYRADIIGRLPDAEQVEARLRESMSWEELLALRGRLGYESKPFYIFQADAYEGLVCNYLELAMGQDPQFLSSNAIDLRAPAAGSALGMMVNMVRRDGLSPREVVTFDEDRSYAYALAHDGLFVRGWPNFIENFRKSSADTSVLRHMRKAALPHFEDRPPTSVFGGWNLMLSKFSRHKSEALELLRFFQSREAQQMLYEIDGFLPIVEEIYRDSLYVEAHPDLSFYATLLGRGFHRPARVDYTRISDILAPYLQSAIAGERTVEEAIRGASDAINDNRAFID